MTPKSLLRHPLCVSTLKDFTTGGFVELIDDTTVKPAQVKRVLFCTGKIYYELLAKKSAEKRNDIAIVRIEQLYPLPEEQMAAIRKKYNKAQYYWVQEEPKNQGAWTFLLRSEDSFSMKLVSRKSSASSASGFSKVFAKEQADILAEAFAK